MLTCVALRLAAVALLVLESEEEAFWCLVAIVETIMPQDYYTKDLVASQVGNHLGPHVLPVETVSCDLTFRPTSGC